MNAPEVAIRAPAGARDGLGAPVLERVAGEIDGVRRSVLRIAEAMVAIAAGVRAAERPLRAEDLLELRPHIADVLTRHEGFVAGAGIVLAPGALCDAPRWIEWWWADRGAGPERLAVDLDPTSAEFYDYTTEEWYREPRRTGRAGIAGPYVDYICTHEYTFTLSVPLRCDGRFAGVAGADVLAAQVERAVVPGLSRLPRVAVLAARNGRVIASNSPRHVPGSVLGRQEHDEELVMVAGGGERAAPLPWSLLAGGSREDAAIR